MSDGYTMLAEYIELMAPVFVSRAKPEMKARTERAVRFASSNLRHRNGAAGDQTPEWIARFCRLLARKRACSPLVLRFLRKAVNEAIKWGDATPARDGVPA